MCRLANVILKAMYLVGVFLSIMGVEGALCAAQTSVSSDPALIVATSPSRARLTMQVGKMVSKTVAEETRGLVSC